ncbi:LLM class flavin-dependent oxidoreductase [Mycolicibacterium mengxianglii]|uniref:LLM class flavin-dependent oxidoreductase n=1 Tax=Mycolicibacterium mengxianglii TaxID=2736649 RepID=UPI0018D0E77D|nr:LLM class flavin-dependent oxidoreductase [Mycolicibacterium mengxianglii]
MAGRPRFGVWANVHGTMAALGHPEDPVDASWARVRDQILLAEELGFDSTLIAQHTMNPLDESLDQLDAWSAAAAAAALTDSIEIIAAIKPSIIHPTILAKQALGIEEISGGRFAVNVVNAWWIPDLERSGIGMLEHGERYVYGSEWLHVVRRLLSGARTTFHGKYFDVDDFVLHPAGTHRSRPRIYLGGESDPARDLAAAEADVLFLNGQSPDDARALIADVRLRPRGGDEPLRYGIAAFVVTAPTAREADELLEYHWELNAQDKAGDGDTIDRFARDTDPASVMWQRLRERPHIGPNGGTAAGLVGDYDTVAARIVDWYRDGIETFMLAFQPFEAEMRRFATEIKPRVGELLQKSELAS